ncbi:MAG: glycosyltransferase family 4 protein [Balneola sp.]|nr:glycosyltransferase family 4 protein [Balneola sp.]MBO6650277.1 glycosyltransferase family 4 protein [Balneola sp.]MBO6712137.1 glycosyltransferase family 4 protein [Balneola sp.]MBO6800331.1 glycosyltransferase family 4 protein [Balneola sp.]MBO6869655.1 glycosyltransferase family 4 protein [Balneola sp.]
MKIALISHLYPTKLYPHQGKFIQDQFNLLADNGNNEVELIVPTPFALPFTGRWKANHSALLSDESKNFRVRYLSFPGRRFPEIIKRHLSKKILSFLLRKKYDVVHLHWAYPDGVVIPDLQDAEFKTVLTIHGSDWYQTKDTPVLSGLIEESFSASDRILYSGPKLKKDIETVFPELSEKSDIIYNMVDTESYSPLSSGDKEMVRKKLNWKLSKKHALTVANIRHEKGLDLLIDTISQNKELADIQFHIVGNRENTEYSDSVINSIEDSPFNNIELIPAVSPKELIKYYQAADFYILPSRREGFNVSILEAAACGLPLVCTNVGGNAEVTDKGAGIITYGLENADSSDIVKMAAGYTDYDPEELNELIKVNYGKSAFLKRLLANYKKALNS